MRRLRTEPVGPLVSLAYSASGKWLVALVLDQGSAFHRLHWWSVTTGESVPPYQFVRQAQFLAVSKHADYLFAVDKRGEIGLYSFDNGRQGQLAIPRVRQVDAMALSDDGQ